MTFDSATKYVQMRFKRQGFCMICGERINEYEPFEYIAVRLGKTKIYNFFHTTCLTNAKPVRIAEAYDELVDQARG